MPIDTSMYASLGQQPTGVQTMGQMVGIANALQQNQALKNQNVQSGIDAQETQNLQPILRNTDAYTDAQGNIDFNRAVPMIMAAAPKNGASVLANLATSQQQRTAAQNAIQGQSTDALQRASNAIFGIDPTTVTPEQLDQTAQALNKNFTSPQAQYATTQLFNNAKNVLANTKPDDPLRATNMQHLAMMYQPIQAQQQINTPNAVQMSNNQQTWLQNVKPGVAGAPQYGMLPNSAVQQQLAPSTQVMGPNNTPGYLGPQMGGQGPGGIQQRPGFVPAGLPAGAAQNIQNNTDAMNSHFQSLQDTSQGNQMIQALKGNINDLADKAITGTGADKLAYYNGLLSQFGGQQATDTKTATDLLQKQFARLNMNTPASTDAARALVDVGSPHSTMTPEAIKEATGQIASQVEANMAIRNHLSGYKYANGGQGDATAYQAERQNIEKAADPRIWQYQDLGPGTPAAKAFMAKQPDAQALVQKAQQLQQMGIF